MRARARATAVRVLEADPDLGAGIDQPDWQAAVAMSVAPEFEFDRGPWRFFPPPEPGGFGALILEGRILIRIDAGTRSHIEMLGQGDLISPWVGTGAELSAPSEVTASVVSQARVALLDRRFALRTARWPSVTRACPGDPGGGGRRLPPVARSPRSSARVRRRRTAAKIAAVPQVTASTTRTIARTGIGGSRWRSGGSRWRSGPWLSSTRPEGEEIGVGHRADGAA